MKKILSLLLTVSLIFIMAACSGPKQNNSAGTNNTATGNVSSKDDPFLTGQKPELNALMLYTAFNMKEQPSYKVVENITGYKVNWFNLPKENADEKLLLEISSGTSYDIIMRSSPIQANQLYVQNALLDLKQYIGKYGNKIYSAVSKIALNSVTDEKGMIYSIPYEMAKVSPEMYVVKVVNYYAYQLYDERCKDTKGNELFLGSAGGGARNLCPQGD